jgi:hypothetical protein
VVVGCGDIGSVIVAAAEWMNAGLDRLLFLIAFDISGDAFFGVR